MTRTSASPMMDDPLGARSQGLIGNATEVRAGQARTPRRQRQSGAASIVRRGLAASACALAAAVSAAPIQFNLAGKVDDDAIGGCGAVVTCGALSLSVVFDSVAPDGNADPALGLYGTGAVTLSIDGAAFFTAPSGVINVANLDGVDQYGLLALGGSWSGGNADLSVLLQDFTHLAFASDALPLTPGALSPLLPGSFTLDDSADQFQLAGTITSVVPEPATSLLLSLGLVACGLARRSRSAAQDDNHSGHRQAGSRHIPTRRPT